MSGLINGTTLVLPLTFEENEEFNGQEYLELYPTITKSEYFNELKYAWVKGKRLPDFLCTRQIS